MYHVHEFGNALPKLIRPTLLMKRKRLSGACAWIIISLAGFWQLYAAAKPGIVLETAAYFEYPGSGRLPKGFMTKNDTCLIDSIAVDSVEKPWMRFGIAEARFWISADHIRFISGGSPDSPAPAATDDFDKKRRLQILQKNQQWPHRIKMAVRSGQICLGMTADQLVASWGQPLQAGSAFAIGIGPYDYRIFKSATGKYLIVSLQNGGVTGWSADR